LGLLLLGAAAPRAFAAANIPGIGEVGAGIGVIGGAVFWGYGVWWIGMAILMTARYVSEGMPFNLGWWAFTFPLGVFSIASLALARQTDLHFLTAIGAALVACLAVAWTVVAARTLHGVWYRYLFVSPCLVHPSIRADLKSVATTHDPS
jgi:tellurite resistance protein TehA-like permease